MSTALPGPGYGFSLVLDIERGQYAGITDSEGIRWVWMVLHHWCNLFKEPKSQCHGLYVVVFMSKEGEY